MTEGGTVARAFEIAQEGTCQTINDIRHQLKRENYSNVAAHLAGPSIHKRLNEILKRGP
jgi:hypothetical protein